MKQGGRFHVHTDFPFGTCDSQQKRPFHGRLGWISCSSLYEFLLSGCFLFLQRSCLRYFEGCHKNCARWKVLQAQQRSVNRKKKNYLEYHNAVCSTVIRQCRSIQPHSFTRWGNGKYIKGNIKRALRFSGCSALFYTDWFVFSCGFRRSVFGRAVQAWTVCRTWISAVGTVSPRARTISACGTLSL